MKNQLRTFLVLVLIILPGYVLADIAVLIHGYHSSGHTWRNNGITSLLASNGWKDTGTYTPQGYIDLFNQPLSNSGKQLITVELPSEASVEVQANLLNQYIDDISQRFPDQKIHLIAHSAGGIVTRLALVNNYTQADKYNVAQLITIASPHLGSPIANMAEKASDTPIGFFAPIIGASEINRAEHLYRQLGKEDVNHFLYWLNQQAHPPMHYSSIIRADGSIIDGDWLVPPRSQNMAYVPAIGSGAQVFLTQGRHRLSYADAHIIIRLLP